MHIEYAPFRKKIEELFKYLSRGESKEKSEAAKLKKLRLLLSGKLDVEFGDPTGKTNGEKRAAFLRFAYSLTDKKLSDNSDLRKRFSNLKQGSVARETALILYFLCYKIKGFEVICVDLDKAIIDPGEIDHFWRDWHPKREFKLDEALEQGKALLELSKIANSSPILDFMKVRENYIEKNINYRNWQRFRDARRKYVHPIGPNKTTAPLVSTCVVDQIQAAISSRRPRQILLVGDIASGKSSCIGIVAQNWLAQNPNNRTVTILPLTSEFSRGRNWNVADASILFVKALASVDKFNSTNHLLIIDDAHEAYSGERSFLTGEVSQDFSHLRIIITCRPEAQSRVRSTLLDDWKVDADVIETRPIETAEVLVSATFSERGRDRYDAILNLLPKLGYSLVAFASALRTLQLYPTRRVTMDLAYEAIATELDRLCDFSVVQSYALNSSDIIDLKLVALTAWMLGGLETPFSAHQLARLLNKIDVTRSLQILEQSEEIFSADNRIYKVKRHPGWGLLVMEAVDEHEELANLSENLRKVLTEAAARKWAIEEIFTKTLAVFLFSVMVLEIRPVKDLAFICAGRHMHDEFFQAATVLQSHAEFGKWRLEDRIQLSLDIASSSRRCRPGNNVQRDKLLDQSYIIAIEAKSDIEKTEDIDERDRLYGYALYEKAYLELRRGQLLQAERSFAESVAHESKNPARQMFGIMSVSIQAIVLSYLRQANDGKKLLDAHKLAVLQLVKNSIKEGKTLRFTVNYYHASYEVALSRRSLSDARKFLDLYVEWQTKVGGVLDREVYDARLELLSGNYSKALDLARVAIGSREAVTHADKYIIARRVYADTLLGTGDTKSAMEIYHSLLPNLQSLFVDPEVQFIRADRLSRLDRGDHPMDILASTRV